VKHLYRTSNQFRLPGNKGASLLLIFTFFWLTVSANYQAQAQQFDFSMREAVKVPTPVVAQLCHYLEKRDGAPMTMGGKYLYVPVFNVLNRSQKQFTDGVYMFLSGSHDSGQLFINQKGKVIILRNGSVSEILSDYGSFLKHYPLPETKQLAYLSAIAAFMQYQYKDIQQLIKSGGLEQLKDKP
jgi:hypothetical protein